MKILLVSPLPPPAGGIATWTVKYLDYCKSNDIDVSVVNIALTGNRGAQVNAKKVFSDEIVRTTRILKDLKKSIEEISPDVVHINTSCSKFGVLRDYLCVKLVKKKAIPVVLQCHCNVKNQLSSNLSRKFFEKMIKAANAVLTLNSESSAYVKSIRQDVGTVIPNFVDSSMLFEKREINTELKELVFVGHVQRNKGCIEIIEAAKTLTQYRFTLVGPVSKELSEMEYPENVSMVGTKNAHEVKEYLLNADAFVFPSYSEGFSLALTEAMACGLPIVATDVGANRDMLEDKGGIIVHEKDVRAIIDAVKKIDNPDVRRQTSEWNVEKVRNNYLPDVVMKQFFDLYEQIM